MTSEIWGAYYLTSSVRYAKGVGKAKAYLLEKLDIKTILDLLWHFPTHYEDRSNLTPIGKTLPGKKQVIQGQLVVVSRLIPRKNFTIIKAAVKDRTGIIYAIWYNQDYLCQVLRKGEEILISGKVQWNFGEKQILVEELSVTELTAQGLLGRGARNLNFHDNNNMFSPLASGSFEVDAMVICPASSHTVSAIAAGLADTLLLRSAYVTLKQRRPLILVHREMPLTAVDLENMLKITRAGGIICPAVPGFYMEPQTINDLVDSVVGRVLDLLGIEHNLPIRWNPET